MTKKQQSMHVNRITRHYRDKSGAERVYVSSLLRRTYRDSGKVCHETLANLSALPDAAIDALQAVLKNKTLVVAGEGLEITRSLPHGHVAAAAAMARKLGFPDILGPPGKERDIAYGVILARVVHPAPKLATAKWVKDTTLASDLGLGDLCTDEIYKAMDWLVERQESIERTLVRRHLGKGPDASALAYFDLSSSWVEGTHNELAAFGYSRDKKRGKAQIEYGLMTDKEGRPVAIEVFPGNTSDPKAFVSMVDKVRSRFSLDRLTMVGDRGMITTARIDALKEIGGFSWITALRAPQIKALAADGGPVQLSLFDQMDLAEIDHPDYPSERLVVCRNPLVAEERTRKREELLKATEADLKKISISVSSGRLKDETKIVLRVGKVLNRHKMAKHFDIEITGNTLFVKRRDDKIAEEKALDGIYLLRTNLNQEDLDAGGVVRAYKALSNVERDFRHIKVDDLALRPIHHRLDPRVRSHVFICMLASYLVWHLRQVLAPVCFTDEEPSVRENPVAPSKRSPGAAAKASAKKNRNGEEVCSFRGLLDHLGTLTRNTVRTTISTVTEFDLLATPTHLQRRVFELLGVPIPRRI